jgi:hypothetical protein
VNVQIMPQRGRVATNARDLATRTCTPVVLLGETGAWNQRHIRLLEAFLGVLMEEQRVGELPACCAAIFQGDGGTNGLGAGRHASPAAAEPPGAFIGGPSWSAMDGPPGGSCPLVSCSPARVRYP